MAVGKRPSTQGGGGGFRSTGFGDDPRRHSHRLSLSQWKSPRDRAKNVPIEFDAEEQDYVENPGRVLPLGGENRRGIMRNKRNIAEDDDPRAVRDPREFLWWRMFNNAEAYRLVRTTVTNVIKDHQTKHELNGATPCGVCVIPYLWDRFSRDPDQTHYPNGNPVDLLDKRRSTQAGKAGKPGGVREELLKLSRARMAQGQKEEDDLAQVGSDRRQAILRQKQQDSRELRLLVRKLAVESAEKGASATGLWPLCEAVTAKLSKSNETALPSRHETAINHLNNVFSPFPLPGFVPVLDADGKMVTKPIAASVDFVLNVYRELPPPVIGGDEPGKQRFIGAWRMSKRYVRFHRFADAVHTLCRVKRLPLRIQAQLPRTLLGEYPGQEVHEVPIDRLLDSLVHMPKMLLQCLYDSARLRVAIGDWFTSLSPPGKNRIPPVDMVQFCYEVQTALFPSFDAKDNVAIAEDDLSRMQFSTKEGVELEGFYQSLFELAMLMHPRHVVPTEDSVDAFFSQLRSFVKKNAAVTKDVYRSMIDGERSSELKEYRMKVMSAHVDDPGARASFEPQQQKDPFVGTFSGKPHRSQQRAPPPPPAASQKAFLSMVKAEFSDTVGGSAEDRAALDALLHPPKEEPDGFDAFEGSTAGSSAAEGYGTHGPASDAVSSSVSTQGEDLDELLEHLAQQSDDSDDALQTTRTRVRLRQEKKRQDQRRSRAQKAADPPTRPPARDRDAASETSEHARDSAHPDTLVGEAVATPRDRKRGGQVIHALYEQKCADRERLAGEAAAAGDGTATPGSEGEGEGEGHLSTPATPCDSTEFVTPRGGCEGSSTGGDGDRESGGEAESDDAGERELVQAATRLGEFDALLEPSQHEQRDERAERLRLQVRRALQARRVNGRKAGTVLDNITFKNRYRPSTTLGANALALQKRKPQVLGVEPPPTSMCLIRNRMMMAKVEGLQASMAGIVTRAGESVTFRNVRRCHEAVMDRVRELQIDGMAEEAAALHADYQELRALPTAYLAAEEERGRRAKERERRRAVLQRRTHRHRSPREELGLGVFEPTPRASTANATITPRPDSSWTDPGKYQVEPICEADLHHQLQLARAEAPSSLSTSLVVRGTPTQSPTPNEERIPCPPGAAQRLIADQERAHKGPGAAASQDGFTDLTEEAASAVSKAARRPAPVKYERGSSARPGARARQTPTVPTDKKQWYAMATALAEEEMKVGGEADLEGRRMATSRLARSAGQRAAPAAKQRQLQDIGKLELTILEHAGASKTPHPPRAFRNMMKILCTVPGQVDAPSGVPRSVVSSHEKDFAKTQVVEGHTVTAVIALVAAIQPECQRTIAKVAAASAGVLSVAFIAATERFYGEVYTS
eukprot:TRINITY_DN17103_c0_g1_i1.p1 TRINITY_DN17103_c0_g1~~TRINITY_DN17103_c0_g1_i1.p1  ORF type:complete len:1397 (+),score=446.29 TRINITY_DN17103_c0_g1_i1:93-4193(+)